MRPSVAVIGSGFGGSVMACRLAESGRYDVTILERGPRYARGSFPRTPEQLGNLFWDPDDGQWGLFEYRSFPLRAFALRRGRRSRIDVLTSSGYGGGSLIYSSVLYRMPERFFDDWPGGIRRPAFDTWYERAEGVFEVQRYPVTETWAYRRAPKARALAEAAAKMRADPRGGPSVTLEWPNLAVRFGAEPGTELTNRSGIRQATCTMCGECNIGCNAGAKSSLDTNYLVRAERAGARARPWTAVRAIRRGDAGRWKLELGDPRGGGESSQEFDRVIVSAGSLGSTFLLLGLRDHLGLDSPGMGTRWSPNGDLLGFVTGSTFARQPTLGPVITGALRVDAGNYPDGFPAGAWIEDGGMPGLLVWYLLGKHSGWWPGVLGLGRVLRVMSGWFGARGGEANIGDSLTRIILRDPAFMTRTMMLLGMGRDRSTGTFTLRPGDEATWDRLRLAWKSGDGELHYQRLRLAMDRIAEAIGGHYVENPLSLLNRYISVHPLGGLPMADRIEDGPVDASSGRVFGCDGLYVVDGSIIPTAVGPNPSLTIAALAEMYAERMLEEAAA